MNESIKNNNFLKEDEIDLKEIFGALIKGNGLLFLWYCSFLYLELFTVFHYQIYINQELYYIRLIQTQAVLEGS